MEVDESVEAVFISGEGERSNGQVGEGGEDEQDGGRRWNGDGKVAVEYGIGGRVCGDGIKQRFKRRFHRVLRQESETL